MPGYYSLYWFRRRRQTMGLELRGSECDMQGTVPPLLLLLLSLLIKFNVHIEPLAMTDTYS
jgi:hypothetical protein